MSSQSKKQRPAATATISLPQVQDASTFSSFSQFSPDANLFAHISLAIDKHRLRIFDATTGSALVEHTIDDARVTSLSWLLLDLASDGTHKEVAPTKKRKKTTTYSPEIPQAKVQLVCLGLSNGSLILFSPVHARVLRTLSHPSSLGATLATTAGTRPSNVWSSGADGVIRLWDAAKNELLSSWKNEGSVPYASLACRPGQHQEFETELLVANHSIRLFPLPISPSSVSESAKLGKGVSFAGHASIVTHLLWDYSHPSRFISVAEADRVINVWRLPDIPTKNGTMIANVPLDAFARHASISSDTSTLLTVSVSGQTAIFELPSLSKPHQGIATLSPRSTISALSKKGGDNVPVISAIFLPFERGRIRVARMKGGVKPIFEAVRYLDDEGEFVPHVSLLEDISSGMMATAQGGPSAVQKRYIETPHLAVRSGFELGQDFDMDNVPGKGIDGDLDVDLAELSLGQRLTAVSGGTASQLADGDTSSTSENDGTSPSKQTTTRRRPKSRMGKESDSDHLPVPAHSLSRTLVQALHSADTRLLETCLLHSDETLVLNTVRRLPPQLAIPLLTACVERLSRGARTSNGKGGGGGASAQRGTGLIRWIRAVLVVHTAHLMTIPDLVARLSSLHATLTARLALRDPLLALSGRLELVLSQIELRASTGPTPLSASKVAGAKGATRGPIKYVEGESESEGNGEGMVLEQDEDTGSIEDVELGGDSASAEEDGSEEEEHDSEAEGSDEGPHLNGFIDDEAEEWSEEEDEDPEE